jgi:hypothetical protein
MEIDLSVSKRLDGVLLSRDEGITNRKNPSLSLGPIMLLRLWSRPPIQVERRNAEPAISEKKTCDGEILFATETGFF